MSDDRPVTLPTPTATRVPMRDEEPPVVARLIVEIRSDGSRTIARGAVEDVLTGQRTTVEARGSTPLALMASLPTAEPPAQQAPPPAVREPAEVA